LDLDLDLDLDLEQPAARAARGHLLLETWNLPRSRTTLPFGQPVL
jgi:hypothetical protein